MPLYQPTNIRPSDLYGAPYVFPVSGLTASWQVNGSNNTPLTAYELLIMENTVRSTLLYDTGKITLDTPFYGYDADGNPRTFTAQKITSQTLEENNIVVSADKEYKMVIIQWWTANDSVRQTSASVFKCVSYPELDIIGLTEVTSASYTFAGEYTQAEGIPLEWVRWYIYNQETYESVADSGKLYNVGELKFSYDGFLPGEYGISLSGEMTGGTDTSIIQTFYVTYNTEKFVGQVKVCPLRITDAVQLTFPETLYLMGTGSGNWKTDEYFYFRTVGGKGELRVNDAATALINSFVITARPEQTGSGTPSRSNVRPFRKWEGASVYCVPTRHTYTTMFPSADDAYVEEETLKGIDDEATVQGGTVAFNASSQWRAYKNTLADSASPAYGFTLNMITGELIIPYGHIASYAGEDLPGAWMSSMDVYTEGSTPSIGAEVVYELASPNIYQTDMHSMDLYGPIGYDITNTLTAYGYIPGSAQMASEAQWDLSMTYYSHGDGKSLMLAAYTDRVSWGTLNIEQGYSIVIETVVYEETGDANLHPKMTIGMDGGILVVCWTNDGFEIDLGLLNPIYAPDFTISAGDTLTIMLESGRVTVIINRGQTDERIYASDLPEWQGNAPSISLFGPQATGYLWMINGNIGTSEMDAVMRADPVFNNDTIMLADFLDGLNAGAVHGDYPISKLHVYRKTEGVSALRKVAVVGISKKELRDYAAYNGATHEYWINAENTVGDLSTTIVTGNVTPMMWNYTLLVCNQKSDGTYRVEKEYRFSLDVASGTISNNSKATLQANFTRYPTRQPTTQNYRSGTLSAYIGKVENGEFSDSMHVIQELRELSISSAPKFLKTRKGEILRVETSDPITFAVSDKFIAQPMKIGLPWAEVDNAENDSVITIIGSDYWPE